MSDDGVLRTKSDSGHEGNRKTSRAKNSSSRVFREASKRKVNGLGYFLGRQGALSRVVRVIGAQNPLGGLETNGISQ